MATYLSHNQITEEMLHHQKLQNVLFASISKILGFLPASELIGFLAVVEGPEVRDLLLVGDHDCVEFAVLEFILR